MFTFQFGNISLNSTVKVLIALTVLVYAPTAGFNYLTSYRNASSVVEIKNEIRGLKDEIRLAKISHSYEVINYHFSYMTADEMISTLRFWSSEEYRWGAQIAAARNMCTYGRGELLKKMTEQEAIRFCNVAF
jgi:hypothetical protein